MVFLFYNKWLLRVLVLLAGLGVGLTAVRYVGLLAAKLPDTGGRDALAIVSFLIAGWLAMVVAEVVDNHYVRVLGCLCVGLGAWVSYSWIFVKDGPQLITLPQGPAWMQQANLGFWLAVGVAALMLVLLVSRLIIDKLNAGRLPAASALARHDRVLSTSAASSTSGSVAPAVDGAAISDGSPAPRSSGDLPPIPIDTSPLNVSAAPDLSAFTTASTGAAVAAPPRTPAPVSRLTGIGGLYVGTSFSLTPGEHSVGRQDAEILLADDSQVSRRHASISVAADGMATLNDAGSTNGSYLNDARITRAELAPGDVLRFGTSLFKVEA